MILINISIDFNLFFMAFTIQKCWEIIFLHLHKLGPMLSFKEIAKELHCSKDTVIICIHRYQETQDIQDQEKTGRKRKTSEKEDTNIITIAKRLRSSSSTEISTSISKQGINI